jgi:hypothetical protein
LDELEIANADESTHNVITPWQDWVSGDKDYIYGQRRFVNVKNSVELPGNSKYIIDTIVGAMQNTAKQYADILNIDGPGVHLEKDFVINKYATGERMGNHVDWNLKNPSLEYSFVVYLNDNYVGGEIFWPNHGIELKPEAGSIVIFPSKEPYLHGVNEIKEGNKIFVPHFWRTTPHP